MTMKRCEQIPFRWDTRGEWRHRWHALFCAECRAAGRADAKLARGARAFRRMRRQAPLPQGLEAEILARLGLEGLIENASAAPPTDVCGPGVATPAGTQAVETAGWKGTKSAFADWFLSLRRQASCLSSPRGPAPAAVRCAAKARLPRFSRQAPAVPPPVYGRVLTGATALAILVLAALHLPLARHSHHATPDQRATLRATAPSRRAPLVPLPARLATRAPDSRATRLRSLPTDDTSRLLQPAAAPRSATAAPSHPVPSSLLGGHDAADLNGDPVADALRWAALPVDEGNALEARVRRAVRVRDDFVQIPFPRLAAASDQQIAEAVESYKREAAVVDTRLFQKVGLQQKSVSFDDFCQELARQSGIRIEASRGVADEKITALVKERPLREVMRQVSRLFSFTWLRSGKEGEYRYELIQDLRSQLLEEELRNRDLNEAFLAMDREMQALRPYLSLTPEELRAKAEAAPTPEQKKRLHELAGAGWGGLQMYFRLSPEEMAALRFGQELAYDSQPDPKERPLPNELRLAVLGTMSGFDFWKQGESFGVGPIGSAPAGAQEHEPKDLPEAQATVSLHASRSELGQIGLQAGSGFAVRSGNGSAAYNLDAVLAQGVSPSVASPANARANAALARDPALQPVVSWRPESSCRCEGDYPGLELPGGPNAGIEGTLEGTSRGSEPVTTADVLAALHRAAGIDLLSDAYTRLYAPAPVSVQKQPLFDALNRVADAMHYRWRKEAGFLLFRSAGYFNDKRKEVPNRLLERWAASIRQHGHLTLDDLVEIAQLQDVQLDSRIVAEGVVRCHGIRGWGLAASPNLRRHLRFLATLDPEQRRLAQSPADLPFRQLNLGQQQQFLAMGFGGCTTPIAPETLLAARLRVDLSMPGQFEWVRETGGARKEFPIERRIRAATREQTLAAARQRDPQATAAQIQPTAADVHVEYALGPGPDGARQFQIVGCWSANGGHEATGR
jgi:hypothetical protein